MESHVNFVFEQLQEQKRSINLRCFLECLLSSLGAASAAVLPKHSSGQPQASHRTSCKHHPQLPENPQLSGTSREKPAPVPRVRLTRQHQPTSTTAPFSVFAFISATHPVGSYETKQNLSCQTWSVLPTSAETASPADKIPPQTQLPPQHRPRGKKGGWS